MNTASFPIATDLNVRDDLKSLTVPQIQAVQKEATLPFAVAAINLNGDLNLGVMMRSAVLFGAERMFIFGRKQYDRRSTTGSHNYIDLTLVEAPTDGGIVPRDQFDQVLAEGGYTPVFIEQGGDDLASFDFTGLNAKPCLVFGNEGYGLPKSFIASSSCVSIAQRGVARSLNVAAASAITIFTCSQQLALNCTPTYGYP